ncbi:MAG: tyrosine-type recombinase/integrase [Streptosporangiaceae bacterium]
MIDGALDHSPAEHVRRPAVPPESPTLGFTHLQFEAMLTASRQSASPSDFALVAMLRLLGLRIFEATSADIADLGEEHGHRVLRVCGKGTKVVLIPLPPAVGRAIDRAVGGRSAGPIVLNTRGRRMDRHAATRRLRHLAQAGSVRIARTHPHMLRHTFVTTPEWTCVMCRSPPGMLIRAPPCATGPPEPRPPPQLHPGRLHGIGRMTPTCQDDTTLPVTGTDRNARDLDGSTGRRRVEG